MLKFIRGKGHQPSAERQKLQKELFAFTKTTQHGFPHKPSALAYDAKDKLMAIGTNSGVIKVFGQPGVEFYGQHTSMNNNAADLIVQQLEWIPGTGRLLSLTASNHLVLWEPAGSLLVALKSLPFDGKLKKISSICCSYNKDIVWIGTEGGNVYQFDIKLFAIKEPVIYHDVVLEQLPSNYKLNPGAIESVKQLPTNHSHLLIAYNRGLTVLWDLESNSVKQSFISPGHGQSVGLYISSDGTQFTWYHADGSFATWDLDSTIPPENQKYVPYGPDPCKAIDRLMRGHRGPCELVVFSGGMPRSAYGDHQCVSVHCRDGTKIAFDFTSKVIDFFITFNDEKPDQAEVLIVLLEEELVAFDLTDKTLPPINAPYLHSIHASAVTCNHLVSGVTPEVFEKIVQAGTVQLADYSKKAWPITGGHVPDSEEEKTDYDIMLTGHEDGSVKFWNCNDVNMMPLLHVKTAPLFGGHDDDFDSPNNQSNDEELEEGEPPFRKAGQFDPYSDDPRLAVKKIQLCPKTGTLIIAGTAGNIVVANFDHSDEEKPIKTATMNLVSDRDGFVWKGHDQLKVKSTLLEEPATVIEGLQFTTVLQVLPPAAITCVALQTKWNVVAAGTAHGLVLFDYQNATAVLHKCTLNPNDLTGAGEALSRRKSFKKTLRESFRRLRKGRSTRNNPSAQQTPAETRPVERQIEARPVDDGMGSMVRCLTFAQTFVANIHSTMPTLWAGTNASFISIFVLHIPPKLEEGEESQPPKPITGQLAKEIHLKHRAPVISISLFDNHGVPLEFHDTITVSTGPHRVLIASEEQFKVFSLPQLKPVTKYKLTAHEGARVRKLAYATFSCTVPAALLQPSPNKQGGAGDAPTTNEVITHAEVNVLCLTNLGDCLVLSVPELRRQLNAAAVRREDINGISSLCFTHHGEGLYMMSSSEVQRISLSATKIMSPRGTIDVETVEEEEEQKTDKDDEEDKADELDDTERAEEAQLSPLSVAITSSPLTNGMNGDHPSPNKANETITSSIGDITIDSVRDHLNTTTSTLNSTGSTLNSTTTTLCSNITEEIVGRISVLSTHSNNTSATAKTKDITELNSSNIKDLKLIGESNETSANSVVIKSVITTVKHGQLNGDTETTKTTNTTNIVRKESQF